MDQAQIIGIVSFVVGVCVTIFGVSKWYMPRSECKSERCGCKNGLIMGEAAHKSEMLQVLSALTKLEERQKLQGQMLLVIIQNMHIPGVDTTRLID